MKSLLCSQAEVADAQHQVRQLQAAADGLASDKASLASQKEALHTALTAAEEQSHQDAASLSALAGELQVELVQHEEARSREAQLEDKLSAAGVQAEQLSQQLSTAGAPRLLHACCAVQACLKCMTA